MNPIIIARKLLSDADKRDGRKWQASLRVDGVEQARPEVKEFDCGFESGGPWFEFLLEGDPKSIKGWYTPSNRGEEIILNGSQVVESADVIISHRWQGARLRGVLEFDYDLDGTTYRHRFDTTLASL
jgi:hypothetical protein